MNGRVGRAKFFAKMKRKLLSEAKAAGVDITDHAAVRAFKISRDKEISARLDKMVADMKALKAVGKLEPYWWEKS